MRTGILKGRKRAQVNVKCFNEPFVIYIADFKSKKAEKWKETCFPNFLHRKQQILLLTPLLHNSIRGSCVLAMTREVIVQIDRCVLARAIKVTPTGCRNLVLTSLYKFHIPHCKIRK